jgi:hypothetical protein
MPVDRKNPLRIVTREIGPHAKSLYTLDELDAAPPRKARIHTSVTCAECREAAMETRIRRLDGRDLCQPCFDLALSPVSLSYCEAPAGADGPVGQGGGGSAAISWSLPPWVSAAREN